MGKFKYLILLSFLLFFISSCKTPLEKLLKSDAPGYVRKAPPDSSPNLGTRVTHDNQPVVNQCFEGVKIADIFHSWQARELNYKGTADSDLSADFGQVIKGKTGAEYENEFTIQLKGVKINRLENLYFSPRCAPQYTNIDSDGEIEKVITRTLIADSIRIEQSSIGDYKIEVDTTKIGGSLDISNSSNRENLYIGSDLYYAMYLEEVRIKRYSNTCELTSGGSCILNVCRLNIRSIGDTTWSGSFSCQENDDATTNLTNIEYGNFKPTYTSKGITYLVNVSRMQEFNTVRTEVVNYQTSAVR